MGLAVIGALLGQGVVRAQCCGGAPCCGGVTPSPVGAARMPEPMPCAAMPNLIEGPITPGQAPPGPPPELSLPANHTGAFQCDNYAEEFACYVGIGGVAWQRSKMGHLPLAVLDQQAPPHTGLDTGALPPHNSPVLLDAAQVSEHYNLAPALTFGVDWGAQEFLEVSAWYLPQNHGQANAVRRGEVDGLFGSQTPFGFSGDNGMWLQADIMTVRRESTTGNIEANYRRDNPALLGSELLLGLRFMYIDETFQYYTGDDDLTFRSVQGLPDPRREAFYTVRGLNRLVIPQAGFEWDYLIWKFISFGVQGKAGFGADFVQETHTLTRGDGFVGFRNVRNEILPTGLVEFGAWLEIGNTERFRFRVGYEALYLLGICMPEDGFSYNLRVHDTLNNHGSCLYQGPMLELQFLF
jgi:hypothetical protein